MYLVFKFFEISSLLMCSVSSFPSSLTKSEKSPISILLISSIVFSVNEKMAKSIGTEKEVLQNIRERLQEFSKTPELVVNKTNMDEILTRLTREYHRSTGS